MAPGGVEQAILVGSSAAGPRRKGLPPKGSSLTRARPKCAEHRTTAALFTAASAASADFAAARGVVKPTITASPVHRAGTSNSGAVEKIFASRGSTVRLWATVQGW